MKRRTFKKQGSLGMKELGLRLKSWRRSPRLRREALPPRQPQPISFLHGPFADDYGSKAHQGEDSLIRFVEVPDKKEQP